MELQTNPLVSIVTVTYNSSKFLKKYFDSLGLQTFRNFEVVVVDNNSEDNSAKLVENLISGGRLIRSKVNTGFAGGCNLGVSNALGKYILFIGPDSWLGPNCLEELVASAKLQENVVLAPKQMSYDGSKFMSCGIAADLFGYANWAFTKDGSRQIRRVFYADGNGIFITKEKYLELGMMDEENFLFHEEVDLCWKSHLFGMQVIPVPSSVIYHWSGGSVGVGGFPKGGTYVTSSHRRYLAERNIIRNILKNYYWRNVIWILPYYLLLNLLESIAMTITGQFSVVFKVYLKAYIWNIKNIASTLSKRRYIQGRRKVGDGEILKIMYKIPSKVFTFLELGIPKVN